MKDFILREFLPGENPDELKADTPLFSSGILDSLATLRLSVFLEDGFGIRMAAHELSEENLGTIADIENLVASKK
ncbi:MAG: acyl carrier protein [Longimicrobiales bacterium]